MSEAPTDRPKPRPLGQTIEIRVAARLESLAAIRSVVTALGALEDLDLDAIADLRLAVDEACTRLIRSAAPDASLLLKVEPKVAEVLVSASTQCVEEDVLRPGTFSWHVISSLTDDLQTFHDGVEIPGEQGRVFGVTMTARRLDASS